MNIFFCENTNEHLTIENDWYAIANLMQASKHLVGAIPAFFLFRTIQKHIQLQSYVFPYSSYLSRILRSKEG
jgi:hypothetical protein